jgi:NAD(P)-dependent dehydrogenase (short-subunit alcohol dehydrogenase family)
MSLYGKLAGKGPNGFGYGSTAEEVTAGLDLQGKTYLVTGCNSGLGLETMRVLAMRGAHVLGSARTTERAEEAGAKATRAGEMTPIACELSDPGSVRSAALAVRQTGRKLDGIVCNAGIMALPERATAHGYELQFFTNHIGHFILVTELLEALSDDGRVVVVSSEAHRQAPLQTIAFDDLAAEKRYRPWLAYAQSKIANILFAKELSRRFEGTKRTANALHPGVIYTNLGRHMSSAMNFLWATGVPIFLKSIAEGAATQAFLAAHPSVATKTGLYFSHSNPARPRRDAEDADKARRLWDVSEDIVAKL